MATERMVNEILDEIAAQYGDRNGWRDTVRPSWIKGLRSVDDRLLAKIVQGLMETEEYRPKLSTVLRAAQKANPKGARATVPGCRSCSNGAILVGRHRRLPEGGFAFEERNARCECPAGANVSASVPLASALERRWRSDPDTVRVVFNASPADRSLDPGAKDRAKARTTEALARIAERDQDDHRAAREVIARRAAGDDSFEDDEIPA